MSELLGKILLIINDHGQSIEDSENLISQLKANIENKLVSNVAKCCFNLDVPKIVKKEEETQNPTKETEIEVSRSDRTTKDRVHEALMEIIKPIVRSKDHIVEASGRTSDLIKYLVDALLSSSKNPAEKSDAEILDFIKSRDTEISNFVENECKRSIASCLADRVQPETPQKVILHSSTVNVTPNVQVMERIDSEVQEQLAVKDVEETTDLGKSAFSVTTKTQRHEPPNPDESDDFQSHLKTMNDKQRNIFTSITVDHLKGVQEVAGKLVNDSRAVNDVINDATARLLEDKCEIMDTDLNGDEPFRRSLKFPSMKLSRKKDGINDSELAQALDNALVGLEMDIRENIYEQHKVQKHENSHRQHSRAAILKNYGAN